MLARTGHAGPARRESFDHLVRHARLDTDEDVIGEKRYIKVIVVP